MDVPIFYEPAQVVRELCTGYHFEGAGKNASRVGDGDAGAYFPEVEGGDAPAVGLPQGLLRARETLPEDLAHPRERVGDGFEVAAAGLGHRRATATATAEHARDLAH